MSDSIETNSTASLEVFLPLIPSISTKRKYWFVRTSGGAYYKDFYFSDVIGIGYNTITTADLKAASIGGTVGFNKLIEKIEEKYPKNKQPRYVAKQLLKFALDIKVGDIVLVPNESSWQIAVGQIESTEVKQKEGTDDDWDDTAKITGFRKYKSVKWLDVFSREALGPKLYSSFYSHHIITDLSDKASEIDRALYAVYEKGGLVYGTIEVNKRSGVNAKELFGLGFKVLELSDEIVTEPNGECLTDDVEVKTNIQSPGDMQFIGEGVAVVVVLALLVRAMLGGSTSFKARKKGADFEISYESESENIFGQVNTLFNGRSQRDIEDRKMKMEEERHRLQMRYIEKAIEGMDVTVRPEVAQLLFKPLPSESQEKKLSQNYENQDDAGVEGSSSPEPPAGTLE